MAPEDSSVRGFQPRFYTGGPSKHFLPLVYDLVAATAPKLVVTAGFGDGQAHFAFCQAVRERRLACRCIAVPANVEEAADDMAWQRGVADAREWFGDISDMIRGSAADVAATVDDNSVDILFIDDCDSYDAARAHFAAWRAKLKPQGIVLLSGIDLERESPVQELWREISADLPAFELHAGSGIGVLMMTAPDHARAPLLQQLFGDNEAQRDLIDSYAVAVELIDARARVTEAERKCAAFEMRQVWLQYLLDDRWNAQDVMDHQLREITNLQGRFDALLTDREEAQRIMDAQLRDLEALRADRATAQQIIDEQAKRFAALEADRAKAQEIMEAQAAEIEATRRDRAHAQLVMDSQAEQLQHFDALRRDRAKAQLIMDSQHEQLREWVATTERVKAELAELQAQVKAQKKLIRFAKESCRRNAKCFQVPSAPKQRRSVPERIAREIQRIPRKLGLLAPAEVVVPTKPAPASVLPEAPVDRYAQWIAEHEPDAAALEEQRHAAATLTDRAKISLLVPVYNTPRNFLEEMLASIAAQTYDEWEICIVDGGSDDTQTIETLARWEKREPKLRVLRLNENLGIAENTNRALELSTGDFVACVDHDDVLAPFAMYELARAIAAAPDADLFYSDEDRLGVDGKRHSPFFKPEWSPELLCSFMYIGHLTAYRRSLLIELGGFRKEFDLSQDYDLAFRASERARDIRHIPHVLYHWREHPASGNMGGKPDARKSNLAALADAMRRRNLPADVIEHPTANRARLKIAQWPRVSIIVPTDSPTRAQICLSELPASTKYPDLEIVIVTNSKLADTLEILRPASASTRLVRYDKPFNFSDKCNAGAEAATGERVIFFNDDVEAMQPDWIQNVIEQLENPEVGAVSPKLLYESGKIQHAGLVMGVRGLAGTAFHQWAADSTDYFNMAQSLRDVSVLSGACLAMRRDDFLRLGGFDAVNTPIAHSDIDLCFRIRDAGMRCVYTPFATLRHAGHVSIAVDEKERVARAKDKASIFLLKRWAGYTTYDPYFTENMRTWLYADSPTPVQMFGRNEPAIRSTELDVLFASHDLTYSGAPLMLLHAALWCRKQGSFVVVMSPTDGPLREKVVDAGVPVIVDPLVSTGHESFTNFARDFDVVVANTILSSATVRAVHGHGVPVLWWLHEPPSVGEHFIGLNATLRATLPLADRLIVPAEATAKFYRAFTDEPVVPLHNGIPGNGEVASPAISGSSSPLRFLLLASIEPRKGQDIFVEAISLLPPAVQKAARFELAGRVLDPEFGAKVKALGASSPNLEISGRANHAEAMELVRAADVVICASRDEAMPLTILEGMSLGKAVIATAVGGAAECIRDGEDGLLVKSEAPEEMAAAMRRLIENPTFVRQLGANARATYEARFTVRRFGNEFLSLLRAVIAEAERPAVTRK